MKYHVYSHTLEIVLPKQVEDELMEELDKIQERVQKRYAKQWIYMDSNQSFYIWRDVAMWFADQHWGVIVVEDWMEYHGWQYLYERNGKRFQRFQRKVVNHEL